MLINLFSTVRNYGVPATLKEFLDLLKALDKNLAFADWDDFYYLSRTILVKVEKYLEVRLLLLERLLCNFHDEPIMLILQFHLA